MHWIVNALLFLCTQIIKEKPEKRILAFPSALTSFFLGLFIECVHSYYTTNQSGRVGSPYSLRHRNLDPDIDDIDSRHVGFLSLTPNFLMYSSCLWKLLSLWKSCTMFYYIHLPSQLVSYLLPFSFPLKFLSFCYLTIEDHWVLAKHSWMYDLLLESYYFARTYYLIENSLFHSQKLRMANISMTSGGILCPTLISMMGLSLAQVSTDIVHSFTKSLFVCVSAVILCPEDSFLIVIPLFWLLSSFHFSFLSGTLSLGVDVVAYMFL